MSKLKLATVWLDGCSGCHMSFLDMDERLLELAELVDVVYSPLVDTKEFPDEVDIALVEGAVASVDDEKKIRKIRAHTKMLVAMGDCAITGNVPSMRNPIGPEAILDRAYIENASAQQQIPCVGGAQAAAGRAPHSRVREGGRFSARLPAFGRHLSHGAYRAGDRRAAGYSGAHPLWSLSASGACLMSQTITIDPVTRLEGHGKITIQLERPGRGRGRALPRHPGARLRAVLRRPAVLRDAQPDGAHLRHLPGLAPDRLGQGLRSHHVGAHSAHRRAIAAHAEPGADGAVARAQLLLSLLARSAAGHGVGPRRRATSSAWRPPSRSWAAPALACAVLASTSSNCWATSASIPDGWFPAASPSRWPRPSATRSWP